MASSLSNLVDNLKKNIDNIDELRKIYKNTSNYFHGDEQIGVYPYDFVNNCNKMYTTILPSKVDFDSK